MLQLNPVSTLPNDYIYVPVRQGYPNRGVRRPRTVRDSPVGRLTGKLLMTDAIFDEHRLLRWRRSGCIKHMLHACAAALSLQQKIDQSPISGWSTFSTYVCAINRGKSSELWQ